METKKLKKEFDGRGLNEQAQANLEEASSIQTDLESLSKQMSEKILNIVAECANLKKPLYSKRHAILRSVPHFWALSFLNHPKLKLLITNAVEDCFNYLQYMEVIETDVKSGYQIHFGFDSNPYFYNSKLIKHYTFDDGNFTMRKTSIDWKDNMNLCNNERKPITSRKRGPPLENFFDWLLRTSSNDVICDIIKDDLWPDPLKYFFLPDEGNDDNSESDTEDDDDCEDFLEYKEDESDEDGSIHSDISTKNS